MIAYLYRILVKFHDKKNKIIERIGLSTGKYLKYTLAEPDSIGQTVSVFKQETNETIKLMRVYGFIENGEFSVIYPAIKLWEFSNVSVFGRNDFIINGKNAYWPKIYTYNFNKNIPLDYNLIAYDDQSITIKDGKNAATVDVAFSLIGVHAQIWSHSLSEYYTKIAVLPKVLEHEKGIVTVLVPDYDDQQLKQIIYDTLSRFERVEIKPVQDGEKIDVKKLYFIERPAAFTDHETYVAIGDNVQPKIVADVIKNNLVSLLVKDAKDESYPKKLFLPRRGNARSLTNNEEVESFFKEQGFFMLEPHKVTLEDKIKYFYNADIIVGPYSSAFSNLIFCKPKTKAVILSNFQRIFESWLVMHYQHFDIDMLFVTGHDVMKKNSAHSSFHIPLDRIKAACNQLTIQFDKSE